MSLYILQPPRRQEDYHRVHIYTAGDKSLPQSHLAFVDVAKEILVVNKYKRSFKPWVRDLSKTPLLLAIIKDSIQQRPRSLLLHNLTGKPFADPREASVHNNKIFTQVFEKHVTLNSLRHSYISWRDRFRLTVGEQQQDAEDMGHSYKLHKTYSFYQNPQERVHAEDIKYMKYKNIRTKNYTCIPVERAMYETHEELDHDTGGVKLVKYVCIPCQALSNQYLNPSGDSLEEADRVTGHILP